MTRPLPTLAHDPLSLDFGRDKKFYVYLYRDPRPNKRDQPIYVGKGGSKLRAESHWRGRTKNIILKRILAKIKADGLEPIIEIIAWTDSEDSAHSLEKSLISKYGRIDLKTGPLANLTGGGEGGWGRKHSKKRIEQMRQYSLGRKHTPEAIEKMRVIAAARGGSAEYRQRASLAAQQNRSKLTDAIVTECRRMIRDRQMPTPDLAKKYGVRTRTMQKAIRGSTFRHLSEPPVAFTLEEYQWQRRVLVGKRHGS